jgi:GAF domain-containing protein
MSTVNIGRTARVFVEMADTLVDDFDVIEFLQMVTLRTSELTNVSACGLLLADQRGRLQFMAASEERAELLELFQVQAEEGPCQDCFHEGNPVVNADLTEASDRWPLFAPRAVSSGFRSVHAFPLRLRQDLIGALNLFGSETGVLLDETDITVVQAMADVATIGLLQERAIRHGEVLTEQLQNALNSRVVIEQAKGVIAQALGCSVDEAFDRLRAYCRRNHKRLSQTALEFVTNPKTMPDELRES